MFPDLYYALQSFCALHVFGFLGVAYKGSECCRGNLLSL